MSCTSDIYFWRQSIVLVSNCLHSVGTGFMLSLPAVLNPAILSPNSTGIHATPEQASWIAASHGMSGVIGFCIVPYLMQTFGRKAVNIGINLLVGIGFLIFALADSVSALYAARITQGFSICGVYITAIISGEYSHPKRRGYFITLKKCSVAIGSLICHSLALCWTWKQIAAFAIVSNTTAIITTFLWPESPAFLALHERYEECDKSYSWLYGDSERNRKDLEDLIATQIENRKQGLNEKKFPTMIKKLMRKDFTRPFLIVSLLTMIIDACGRYYMLAYIVEILIDITKDKSIAVYCTIGSDILTAVALIISCFVIRCYDRRTLLFSSGTLSVLVMFSISLFTYLRSHYGIGESLYWLIPIMILANVFIVNVGVIPTCFAITCEIFPLEHKGTGACATGIVFSILYALVMKFTPLMMEKTGVVGTFGIYGLHVLGGLIILYFILLETKDKTLQEIENEIKGVKPMLLNLNDKPLIGS